MIINKYKITVNGNIFTNVLAESAAKALNVAARLFGKEDKFEVQSEEFHHDSKEYKSHKDLVLKPTLTSARFVPGDEEFSEELVAASVLEAYTEGTIVKF